MAETIAAPVAVGAQPPDSLGRRLLHALWPEALVLIVFAFTAGLGLVEGVLAYAGVGAAVFFLARKTFR